MAKKEYIAKELILSALENAGGCDGSTEWDKGYDAAIEAAIEIAENIPAADVALIKHGNFSSTDGKIFKCSECGYSFEYEGYIHFFNFCPSCGAAMNRK